MLKIQDCSISGQGLIYNYCKREINAIFLKKQRGLITLYVSHLSNGIIRLYLVGKLRFLLLLFFFFFFVACFTLEIMDKLHSNSYLFFPFSFLRFVLLQTMQFQQMKTTQYSLSPYYSYCKFVTIQCGFWVQNMYDIYARTVNMGKQCINSGDGEGLNFPNSEHGSDN